MIITQSILAVLSYSVASALGLKRVDGLTPKLSFNHGSRLSQRLNTVSPEIESINSASQSTVSQISLKSATLSIDAMPFASQEEKNYFFGSRIKQSVRRPYPSVEESLEEIPPLSSAPDICISDNAMLPTKVVDDNPNIGDDKIVKSTAKADNTLSTQSTVKIDEMDTKVDRVSYFYGGRSVKKMTTDSKIPIIDNDVAPQVQPTVSAEAIELITQVKVQDSPKPSITAFKLDSGDSSDSESVFIAEATEKRNYAFGSRIIKPNAKHDDLAISDDKGNVNYSDSIEPYEVAKEEGSIFDGPVSKDKLILTSVDTSRVELAPKADVTSSVDYPKIEPRTASFTKVPERSTRLPESISSLAVFEAPIVLRDKSASQLLVITGQTATSTAWTVVKLVTRFMPNENFVLQNLGSS
jgi:hypothetical protein